MALGTDVDHRPSLRKSFRWTFAANGINAACQWGMIASFAKLGNAEDVGRYALGLAVSAPVISLASLHLAAVQATDAQGEYRFQDYFSARIITTIAACLVISMVAMISARDTSSAWIIVLVGLIKGLESLSEIVRSLFQKHERMPLSASSLLIKGLGSLSIASVGYWMTGQLSVVLGLVALFVACVVGFFDLPHAVRLLRQSMPGQDTRFALTSFSPRTIWSVMTRAFPLGIGIFLLTLQNNIPRYFLTGVHGNKALGYFTAMAYLSVLGTFVVSALGQAAAPRLSVFHVDNPLAYRRLLFRLLGLGAVMGIAYVIAVVTVGPIAMSFLYRPEYAQFHREFIVIALSGAISFVTFFCGYGLVATRIFRSQLVAGILGSTAGAVIAFLLVPSHGLLGAGITLLATSMITLACYLAGVRSALRAVDL